MHKIILTFKHLKKLVFDIKPLNNDIIFYMGEWIKKNHLGKHIIKIDDSKKIVIIAFETQHDARYFDIAFGLNSK